MSKLIDIPVKPFTVPNAPDLQHNVVRVSMDYDKRNTGPVASLQAAECGPPESGFSSFRMVIFASPSARVSVEKGWKTNNKKRLDAARDQVLLEISQKRGDTYAAIVKLLADNGSEIVEQPAEVAVA